MTTCFNFYKFLRIQTDSMLVVRFIRYLFSGNVTGLGYYAIILAFNFVIRSLLVI